MILHSIISFLFLNKQILKVSDLLFSLENKYKIVEVIKCIK